LLAAKSRLHLVALEQRRAGEGQFSLEYTAVADTLMAWKENPESDAPRSTARQPYANRETDSSEAFAQDREFERNDASASTKRVREN
jgi:hypothetical protein